MSVSSADNDEIVTETTSDTAQLIDDVPEEASSSNYTQLNKSVHFQVCNFFSNINNHTIIL